MGARAPPRTSGEISRRLIFPCRALTLISQRQTQRTCKFLKGAAACSPPVSFLFSYAVKMEAEKERERERGGSNEGRRKAKACKEFPARVSVLCIYVYIVSFPCS